MRKLGSELRHLRMLKADAEAMIEDDNDFFDDEDQERLNQLEKLANQLRVVDLEECELVIVNEGDFVEFAQDKAEDTYSSIRSGGWPFDHIDWEKAAEALQQDYRSIDFDDQRYWVGLG